MAARAERGGRLRLVRQLPLEAFRRLHQLRRFLRAGRLVVRITREHPLADDVGEVIAAKPGVAATGAHFNHAFKHINDGNVKCAAAQIENQKLLLAVIGKAVGERGRRRFIHQPLNRKPSQMPGGFHRFTLDIVKPGRHGDHRAGNWRAKRHFRIGFQLAKH